MSELSIKSWAEEDRPREKLMLKGKSTLSEAELIGILLGSGTQRLSAVDVAKLLLNQADNSLNRLARFGIKDYKKIKGIGEAKAITIISALELGNRRKSEAKEDLQQITCSEDVYELMKPHLLDLPHEEFWVILLNRANYVIKKESVSKGGVSGTVADPKVIFKKAVDEMSSNIILVHNHPSGRLKPSQADIQLTHKMREGGKILDIPVLDHLIFSNHGYFSFADEGLF
ncbi:DNA repair protein RadC [Rapidithrix thailandica]|uniref:DNA repair protein RadC n=1 Tax=Rapidithrix thailandica TaxID=413964 RepID=A0AAW9S145_9BACT